MRKWGRLGIRRRAEELDEYGLDHDYEQRLRPLIDFAFTNYFRVDVQCVHHVPASGR